MSTDTPDDDEPERRPIELTPTEEAAFRDLLETAHWLESFTHERAVEDLSRNVTPLLKLLTALGSTDLVDVLERGLQDPELDRALLDPPEAGLVELVRAERDEDFRRGVGVLLALVKAIGRQSEVVGERRDT